MISLLAGSYTETPSAFGLTRLRVDEREGRLLPPEPLLRTRDVSYLLRAGGCLYWVDEALGEKAGRLVKAVREGECYREEGSVSTKGENPCHLAMSPDGRWMAAANYTSGSVALFPLDREGMPGEAQLFPGAHGSADPVRQEGPHAHFVFFDGPDRLYAADLGADEIRCLEKRGGRFEETGAALRFPPGTGPRHFLKKGDTFLVAAELDDAFLRVGPGGTERMPLFPGGGGTAAALREGPDGKYYLTERGHDLLCVFREEEGKLVMESSSQAGGKVPRDCLPLEGLCLCACQAGEVTLLARGVDGGWLVKDRAEVPGAVCLVKED